MHRQEYTNLMYDKSSAIDKKTKLWQAVHRGDYIKFKELIDNNTLSDINEYKFGITLLHALVLNDGCIDNEEIYKNKAQIAQYLLSLGANLNAQADENAPWPIKARQTPLDMAGLYDSLPFYYSKGMRASFAYTGEHVLPVFKKHLGIETKPSMLFQFGRMCAEHPATFVGLCAGAMVTGVYLKSGGKLSELPQKIATLRSAL